MDKCWFLHPNLVLGHLNHMLRGIHARRAACTPPLEDLSARYPCIARGAAAVSRAGAEEEVCEVCPDASTAQAEEDVSVTDKMDVVQLSSTMCEMHERALAAKSASDVVELMVDGGASVDATGDESMFDPSTLVPAVGKFIEVANGVVSPETFAD